MKAGRAFGCLFWALLYCVLYLDLVNASSEDELMDFDFADASAKYGDSSASLEDWPLDDDEQQQSQQAEKKLENNMLDFSVDLDEPEPEKQLPQFDWRERVLRTALAKALTDRAQRQKFAEVMPILRVLSSQQRLALSALISAQMNAKQGHELRLEQVRMMFGNDRKLLLPVVYDLANLVKSSARKYIKLGSEMAAAALRRKDELTAEESEQDDSVGTIDVSGQSEDGLEDFFDEMQAEVLDPQMINEALQPASNPPPTSNSNSSSTASRVRRSANEFVHKLTRSAPISVSEQQLLGGAAGRTIKLNTTAFQQPSAAGTQQAITSSTTTTTVIVTPTPSFEEIENLAFAGLNGTELPLTDIDRHYQLGAGNSSAEEQLPSPEELIAGPRYRLNNHKRPSQKLPAIKRKRVQSPSYGRGRPKTSASSHNPVVLPTHKKCERFTNNMCIRTDDYPLEQIMGSIRRHKNAMSALLAEFYDKPNNNLEFGDEFDDYVVNKKRREDEGSAGGMCQSVVRYARPQKAKAASGEWKFIVNTGQHTQTLRLEKCSHPGESCSYLAQTYRSHCSQVFNYHRLLSWDKVRGLHVDIFKVPTCCSCQVDGYRQQFPPLSSIQAKDYTPINNYKLDNGYSTINEDDLDYNEESEEDDLGLNYSPYNHHRDTNELSYLGSKKVRSKLPSPSSVGPYLSPPDDDNQFASYKPAHKSTSSSSSSSSSSSGSSSKKYYQHLSRRRPQHNEPRVDVDLSLDLAGSETQAEQEVNVFGQPLLAGEELQQQRVPIKRKRIYSSTPTHTATTTTGGTARLPIQHVSHKPQTTAAATTSSSSSSLPARTGAAAAAAAAASGGATYAHQAAGSVASGATASSDAAFQPAQRISYYANGEKPRPRFYAPLPTTPAAPVTSPAGAATPLSSSPSTATTVQQKQSTPQFSQPASHINSIYSNSNHHNNGSRRINYSYHPIIDFFEQRANSRVDQHQQEFVVGATQRVEQRYPATTAFKQTFPTANERRMGFGGGGGGVANAAVRYGYANDNAWQPLVVDH